MNDLLKGLSRLLEPFGYRIRPTKGLNFLSLPNLHKDDVADLPGCLRLLPPAGNLQDLTVYMRTCLRESRNARVKDIPGGADLTETTRRCLYSTMKAINYALDHMPDMKIKLVILDDRSDESFAKEIRKSLAFVKAPSEFRITESPGQGPSLHQAFEESLGREHLVYFVEDDYLHEQDGIFRLCEFYKMMAEKTGSHLMLYPQEHPTIYNGHYPSYIVIGADRHWRSIRHATHTFFTHSNVVKNYWHYFENTKYVGHPKKRQKGSEAKTTNKLFLHIPGFSPLRPCAVHFQGVGLLPPLYDWKKLWEQSDGAKTLPMIFLAHMAAGLSSISLLMQPL